MGRIFLFCAAFAACLLTAACGTFQRTVEVRDADTGVPVSGAFVYASTADIVAPYAPCGLYKTDASGRVKIDDTARVLTIISGKEGYDLATVCDEGIKIGDELKTELKLKRENPSARHPARVLAFRAFPSNAGEIVNEMSAYFGRRNTIMTTIGQEYVIDAKFVVRDHSTKRPIPDAMVHVRQRMPLFGQREYVVAADSKGIATVPLELNYARLVVDAGKEGYAPTKKFSPDLYKHGVYYVELSRKPRAGDSARPVMVVSDTSEFSRRQTDIPVWERFKKYYYKAGGTIKYISETR